MNYDGYPTDEELKTIKEWDPFDFEGLAEYCHKLWIYEDYTEWDGKVWYASTGGWSGHEEIISSLPPLWKSMFEDLRRRGGHYIFSRVWGKHDQDR